MSFDQKGNPVPTTTKSTWRDDWSSLLRSCIFLAAFIWCIYLVYQDQQGVSLVGTAGVTPVILKSDPLPPELVQAMSAMATAFAPTPTPSPTPVTPTVEPTPPKPTCEYADTKGPCNWAPPAQITTPIPICDTPVPYQECYKDGPIRIGTPVG